MNENLEEIIKIAWASEPVKTDYYLRRYIVEIVKEINLVTKDIDMYEYEEDQEFEHWYNSFIDKREILQRKLNRLNCIISSLQGS